MPDSLLYESSKSKIYFKDNKNEKGASVVKVLNLDYPTPFEIEQFFNEFGIIEGLQLKHSRNSLRKTKVNHRHAIELEWYDGLTLKEVFGKKKGSILDFLHISIALAEAVAEIHSLNIIHKDIAPGNILVNLQKREVKLIDFGIASTFDLKQHHSSNPEKLEGTLAYCSPEETGRMNRRIDHRSDLYSLGAVMYEMITGVLPFTTQDALELVHCHIAQTPVPVDIVNPEIPKAISGIIGKLMSKKAEDRYQSAIGLKVDLIHCLEQWMKSESIADFVLGEEDFSAKFSLPQKLYGREKDIDSLINAFDHCALGDMAIVEVAGFSGTGKSVLVHEVHKPITARRGYFIEGKFDQNQRSVPYYAIISAFQGLVDILLTENEERLGIIRNEIVDAIGKEGKILTNVIPNLVHIVGEQPEVPELGGTESQNRFNYVIRNFVKAISTREHPIVMFIDDMQWADSASLSLFKTLMTDFENKYLLCIVAYRDNEVSESHPYRMMIKEIASVGTNVSTIHISNLSSENVLELVQDTLDKSDDKTKELADLIYAKTDGNAFFVTQFIKSLYDDGLLVFDIAKKSWTWDNSKIKTLSVADNVVDLVASNIQKLSQNTQSTIKLASCIGNIFDLEILAHIMGHQSVGRLEKELEEAFREGFISPLSGRKIKFMHDRIQQAVYSLISEEDKKEMHLMIGRFLLDNWDRDGKGELLFDIVNQWNAALDLLNSDEKLSIAKLNLDAGVIAKNNSAFDNSLDYLNKGIGLLEEGHWENNYSLSLQLYTESIEAAYLCSKFDEVEELFGLIMQYAKSTLERVKPYEIKIHSYKAQNRLLEAVQTGLELLEELGERFPKKPNMGHVFRDLVATALKLRSKSDEDLLNLPPMKDPIKIAVMRIGADIMPSVYWATPTLVPVLAFRMVQISLKHGNSPVSAFAYGSYGVLMCGVLEFMSVGYKFGKLAIRLLDKLNAKEWKAQIYVTTYALILFWREHVKNTLPPLKDSFHIGLETGAIEFACVNTNIYCIHAFLCGKPLKELEMETASFSQSFKEFKQMTNFYYNEVYHQAMLNLMGESEDPYILTGSVYDEEVRMAQNTERNDQTGTFFIHFNKLILGYHFGRHEEAAKNAMAARKLLEAVLAKFEISNLLFFEALNHIALYETSNGKKGNLSRARKNRRKLKKWARFAPENFEHRYRLIEAELLRIRGRKNEARKVYDEAIAGAARNEYLNDEALAFELAGKFYLSENSMDLAEYYLKSSYNKYREWGATAKLLYLAEHFPAYVSKMTPRGENDLVSTTHTYSLDTRLDINTVQKASTSISGEVVLSKLISKLLELLVENAGAQRGDLILEYSGELYLQGQYNIEGGQISVLKNIPIAKVSDLPSTIISYVKRTLETVVINEIGKDRRFGSDDYLERIGPQSLLCFPIINQGKFLGMIYLEHKEITDIFSEGRIQLLTLLSGQIAVSIDNAILYRQLEQKVEERTAELATEKKKSDDLLNNILPEETAEELKRFGKTTPRKFESITVLFTDFVDFTKTSENLSPEEIVSAIDTCFSAFDELASKYGVEKIKTIGDSYMCAGGLPVPNSTHAEDCIKMAIEMRTYIEKFNVKRKKEKLPILEVRIGLHTGPVVAGVVGTKKFAYDIWGDTVNTASRMESSGQKGKVNVSGSTFELVKDKFLFESRGKIAAKNKGDVTMYFVENLE